MTRINTEVPINTLKWVQNSQDQIKAHPAWHCPISAIESEIILKNEKAFTYLLRSGEDKYSYFISFVEEKGSIKHQFFVLELDRKGWYYRNGTVDSCVTEIISKDLTELIPLMMHCDFSVCCPFTRPRD